MQIDWDVEIPMDDGLVVRADVFRPKEEGRYPVLMSYGPYAKGLPFQVGFPAQWQSLTTKHPEILKGSSSKYANWETADPERWVPLGYICIRVDSRGAGRSPGVIDCFSPREAQDFYDCIEWAAKQPWSNGKIGLAGVSYYGATQWLVAAKRPPHLAAICPFEGFSDYYRDACRHGGILNTFMVAWYPKQVENVQHGLGRRGHVNPNTGLPISGPAELSDEELLANRVDINATQLSAELISDSYFDGRRADLGAIEVPVLSCANWGGHGLHLRGNVQGYLGAGSKHKWLELHGLEHWTEFYTDYGVALQKRFFDRFLKGEDNGWDRQPPIKMQVRHVDRFVERDEHEWPLARTAWTPMYLDAGAQSLRSEPSVTASRVSFDGMAGKVSFSTAPFERETEVTGPLSATLWISTTARDADLFLTLRAFAPDGKEHLILGAVEPNAPLAQGWLRASHRKLDPQASRPYQPVHTHQEIQLLEPNEIYELQVEIWPMCFVFPKGYRLVLTVGSSDFEHDLPGPYPQIYGKSMRGSSVLLHDHPDDRRSDRFAGQTTVHTGEKYASFLLLPVIPATC
ncbi:CocE/NonD family hydrolase (plasmid) [Cupriavidus sp. KK10]|jgi:predicted acyl esterase|uniref:CocE/NonD family hydrolase n=1 Tax=Cupriavidus sp. KK10 TaxID=1478019 RepID=UPI001BA59570|nr:CocE/NonD family hydrolase [Cupriavidus sp. KK10]QUN32722.1 CocE/NonD family hydrolase [Cupriavidus sp. KK10]